MSDRLHRPHYQPLSRRAQLATALDGLSGRKVAAALVVVILGWFALATVMRSREVINDLGSRHPIAVAVGSLTPGHTLEPGDISWVAWPRALVPGGAIVSGSTQAQTLVGTRTRAPLAPGEPILTSRLLSADDDLATRRVTIPVPLAPPPLRVGDIVELIGIQPITTFADTPTLSTRALGRAEVNTIDETGLTLAVTDTQVLPIIETMATGSVEIVITPFGS